MLEKLMKLYVMAMTHDVRSPMPHIVGPPGCGKSTVAEQLASLLGVNLHIINVSRLSPLEVEGVQMPVDHADGMRLSMLAATFWTQLKEGDIILLDEFLRGFPEVYNALLDILTSRRAGGFVLPKVFIMGASNSTASYDKALEDRLLHLPVPDPRNNKKVRESLAKLIIDEVGLNPVMLKDSHMEAVILTEVVPMFSILDSFKGQGQSAAPQSSQGRSLRNLIGQAKMREVQSATLENLIVTNNNLSMRDDKPQFVVLLSGKRQDLPFGYAGAVRQLVGNPRLTPLQAKNLQLNLQLIEMESARFTQEGTDDDDPFIDYAPAF